MDLGNRFLVRHDNLGSRPHHDDNLPGDFLDSVVRLSDRNVHQAKGVLRLLEAAGFPWLQPATVLPYKPSVVGAMLLVALQQPRSILEPEAVHPTLLPHVHQAIANCQRENERITSREVCPLLVLSHPRNHHIPEERNGSFNVGLETTTLAAVVKAGRVCSASFMQPPILQG